MKPRSPQCVVMSDAPSSDEEAPPQKIKDMMKKKSSIKRPSSNARPIASSTKYEDKIALSPAKSTESLIEEVKLDEIKKEAAKVVRQNMAL